jgi:exosortase B
MVYSDALSATRTLASRGLLWPILVTTAVIVAYIPTFIELAQGPWQSEQEGHGPLIIAAALWLAWQSRGRISGANLSPAPISGWFVLLFGLMLMVLARNQDVLSLEVASEIPVIAGCLLLLVGWNVLRMLAFPILFLIFSAPAPGWMIDAATIPLKVLISDLVTQALYTAGYPIAQNGVVILIGPYQLLVKDACSGLNSVFALSAIGVFYVFAFRWHEKIRSLILLSLMIPITIVANFIRVMSLVLIAYYGGADKLDGVLHDLTGIALFVVAMALLFACDGFLSVCSGLLRNLRSSRRLSGTSR